VKLREISSSESSEPKVYLDYHASTPVDPRVVEAMLPWWQGRPGNAHSDEHSFGWRARAAIQTARTQIANLTDADSEDIIFTSGATESNNLAILGAARGQNSTRRTLLVTEIEHSSVLGPAHALEREGFRCVTLPVDGYGFVDRDTLLNNLSEDTALVSVGACNNEIGTLQDLQWIAKRCHEVGALFHTDAAQSLTASALMLSRWDVDLASLSAHKAYGPQGIGALYVRAGLSRVMQPTSFGGGQQHNLRPGSLPTALCVGFGMACELIRSLGNDERQRIRMMRDRLIASLLEIRGTSLNGPSECRHPGNVNIEMSGVDARDLIQRMQPEIGLSTGSACHSGSEEPSQVLTAIGLTKERAFASFRIGIGRFTTELEIDYLLTTLRSLLPHVVSTLPLPQ
jgi:cysteine desulfurase